MKLKYSIAIITLLIVTSCGNDGIEVVEGCTDHFAINFEPNATVDDCDCSYEGFTVPGFPPPTAIKNILLEPGSDRFHTQVQQFQIDYPGRMFVISNTNDSFLDHRNQNINRTNGTSLQRFRGVYYEGVLVNRILGDTDNDWETRTVNELRATAQAELSVQTKIEEGKVRGLISVDFKERQNAKGYRLYVYAKADHLALDHKSYEYEDRALKILGNYEIAEKASNDEGIFTRLFEFDISSLNANTRNIEIVAFITDNESLNILNSNAVPAGSNIRWNNIGDF